MLDIESVRKQMLVWGRTTYYDGLVSYLDDADDIAFVEDILQTQQLRDKLMKGNSVQRIPVKYEGPLQTITFSEIFYDCLYSEKLSPISYIVEIIKAGVQLNYPMDIIVGIVGRGLRSFPSFLREMDLRIKLAEALPGAICDRTSPEDDVSKHIDLYMDYDNQRYMIWSYQGSSDRAQSNTLSKLRGSRGEIPDGTHILCPFDVFDSYQYEDISGWRLYNKKYVESIVELLLTGEIENYSVIKNGDVPVLKEYISKPHILLK